MEFPWVKKEEVKTKEEVININIEETNIVRELLSNYTITVITKTGANQTFIVTDISFQGLRNYIEGSARVGVIYLGDGKYKNFSEIADITFKENK